MPTAQYPAFESGMPVGTQTPPAFAVSANRNIHALRDAVVCGAAKGFAYSVSGGTPGAPASRMWANNDTGVRFRFDVISYGTDAARKRPELVEWFYSTDGGASWATISNAPVTITWSANGFVEAVTNDAGMWVLAIESLYRTTFFSDFAVSGAINYGTRIAQAAPVDYTVSGDWDWATTPTHGRAPGGITLNIINAQIGELKRIWLQTANPITFTVPNGRFDWGNGSPLYGVWAIISLVCVDTAHIIGSTTKVGT
jgi:hypothetical protein